MQIGMRWLPSPTVETKSIALLRRGGKMIETKKYAIAVDDNEGDNEGDDMGDNFVASA